MAKRTILIAENDGIISLDLKTILRNNNYQPVIVKSHIELLDRCREKKPDLIIADLFFGKDSSEKTLIDINKNDSIPVILISGSSRSQLERVAKKMSPCDYLLKPFDKSELIDLISKFLDDNS